MFHRIVDFFNVNYGEGTSLTSTMVKLLIIGLCIYIAIKYLNYKQWRKEKYHAIRFCN